MIKLPSGMTLSNEEPLEDNFWFMILGKIGAGKSSLALTASEKFDGWKKHAKPVICDDMAWLLTDKKGAIGFASYNYKVPMFDLPRIMTREEAWRALGFNKPPTFLDAIGRCIEKIGSMKPRPKWLVVDGITSVDARFVGTARMEYQGKDGRKLWGLVKTYHLAFWSSISSLGDGVIMLAHPKVAGFDMLPDDVSEETIQRKEALQTAGGGTLIPDISGSGAAAYKRDDCIQLYVEAKDTHKGGKKVRERTVTTGGDEAESKNRFEDILGNGPLPPNLGEILNKIKGGLNGG